MSLTSDFLRGNTDTIILSALSGGDSYGYAIVKTIRAITDEQFNLKEATLYTSFRRLEEAGCIVSYWGEPEAGPRRRYYSITDIGRKQLIKSRESWLRERTMLEKLIFSQEGYHAGTDPCACGATSRERSRIPANS
ncbi:hypothetical protein SDC9_141719 [bioreactor metagenome]|uniref:Transcription regulator PadR N-terminal domain-containing protein n=1 Tax=bioreactor metagenome TaxID=1076179 RepID=A0A645E142_9ZZZZ|nr:helix-turn-helix transcriptional regulator [Candidatus Pelethousia sp.]NCB31100.1 PadR family transcriptional regulator [Clostridia bacterium]